MKQALIYITSILIGITLISMIVYGILDILVSFNLTENNTIINIRNIIFDYLWCIQSLIIIVILIIVLVYLIKKKTNQKKLKSKNSFRS